ncbi:MAG: G5 domain-containing protein [Anaerolineales bacterium]|nr:G5 domain-containing protein [Anaerolineales bacterium]
MRSGRWKVESRKLPTTFYFLLSFIASACATPASAPLFPTATPSPIIITVIADGQTQRFALTRPMTVREALLQAGFTIGETDRTEPAPFTRLSDGMTVRLVRVRETFETEQVVVPFESQVIANEGLPRGERRLLQAGANGLAELTYRIVFEDGVQVSRSVINRVILKEPTPEIITVGAQTAFTVVPITGTLAYLSGGNAWIMRGDSSRRTPLTTGGDLDGFVFDLSPDGQALLYSRTFTDTRSPQFDRVFNTLWVITLTQTVRAPQPALNLPVSNTLYAEWSPVQTVSPTIAFSTGEKNPRGPLLWQANNDLWLMSWWTNPRTRQLEFLQTPVVETNSGGLYGWWGTGYAFALDGQRIAYARTDSIGLIDLATFQRTELTQFAPFNSRQEWAWYPTLRWAEGDWLYTVTHGAPLGFELPEDSPVFDVTALSPGLQLELNLVPRAGIFANPAPSPRLATTEGERPIRIAFLQAIEPNTSPQSRYRLAVMDRDGSNLRLVFPPDEQPGFEAGAAFSWSPDGRLIAAIYQGNLWLIDPDSGVSQQLTGDGLTTRVEWGR